MGRKIDVCFKFPQSGYEGIDILRDRKFGSEGISFAISLLNYSFIPNVYGEELDVYLIGLDVSATEYKAKVVTIVHRENDDRIKRKL